MLADPQEQGPRQERHPDAVAVSDPVVATAEAAVTVSEPTAPVPPPLPAKVATPDSAPAAGNGGKSREKKRRKKRRKKPECRKLPPEKRAVYTVQEAGALLHLGKNQAYQAALNGQIPTIKIGSRLLVPRVAFDRMLEAKA